MSDDPQDRDLDASFGTDPKDAPHPEKHVELRPGEDHKPWEVMARIWSRGMPTHAVADRFFTADVIAVVVREMGVELARLVIVGADALDDSALCLAGMVLQMDELELPDAVARRILTIFADGRVCLQTIDASGADVISWRRSTAPLFSGENNMRRVRRLVAAAVPQTIPGVGVVRVAPHRGSPDWEESSRWIDDYNSAVCRAAADLVQADPGLIDRARKTVEGWSGIRPSSLRDGIRTWEAILTSGSASEVLATVLGVLRSQEPDGAILRKTAPFLGMVPPNVREAILRDVEKR